MPFILSDSHFYLSTMLLSVLQQTSICLGRCPSNFFYWELKNHMCTLMPSEAAHAFNAS